jgi:pimeloyl-ACP methyl ester carboxylesterase
VIPIQFGQRDRVLFGVHMPALERRRRRGVVICNPWGGEALRAHRSLRFLGDLLVQNGFDVLRFDYSGTGDSFGDAAAARLTHWVEDTELAIDELVGLAGVPRVSVVGLRLGSYVAAAAAAGRPREVERVVLWEPILHGRDFVREITEGPGGTNGEGIRRVAGFPLTPAFRDDVERCSLAGLPGSPFTVLVVHSGSTPAIDVSGLAGKEVAVVGEEGPPCWLEERNSGAGALPVTLLRKVTEWLS